MARKSRRIGSLATSFLVERSEALGFWPEMCWSQLAAVEKPDVMLMFCSLLSEFDVSFDITITARVLMSVCLVCVDR